MTVFEGVSDQQRSASHWTTFLPLDAPLGEVDELFEQLFRNSAPLGEVVMRFKELDLGSAIKIILESEDEQRIRSYRNALSSLFCLRFPDHDHYVFHISLGYGLIPPTKEQERVLYEIKVSFDTTYADDPITFTLLPPALTFFEDMKYFSPLRLKR